MEIDPRLGRIHDALLQELQRWARGQGILQPGQRLVLDIRIENAEADILSDICPRSTYRVTYLRRAELTRAQMMAVLALLPRNARAFMHDQLLVRHNAASELPSPHIHQNINNALARSPIDGVTLRLASEKRQCQLWEIEPITEPAAMPAVVLEGVPITDADWGAVFAGQWKPGDRRILELLREHTTGLSESGDGWHVSSTRVQQINRALKVRNLPFIIRSFYSRVQGRGSTLFKLYRVDRSAS